MRTFFWMDFHLSGAVKEDGESHSRFFQRNKNCSMSVLFPSKSQLRQHRPSPKNLYIIRLIIVLVFQLRRGFGFIFPCVAFHSEKQHFITGELSSSFLDLQMALRDCVLISTSYFRKLHYHSGVKIQGGIKVSIWQKEFFHQ